MTGLQVDPSYVLGPVRCAVLEALNNNAVLEGSCDVNELKHNENRFVTPFNANTLSLPEGCIAV